ncbi:MAG: phosphotransferase family protein [Novosphingobium sp.]|nr:phosphotransferase family protein [Novosphingobium sp.]
MTRSGQDGLIADLERLSGGASMESWAFTCGSEAYVLRRAPSAEVMDGRPLDHASEAALIRAVREGGVIAPEVIAELWPDDGIGSGFVMRRIAGTADPQAALGCHQPGRLLAELAATLARIHSVPLASLPILPRLDPGEGVEGLARQFAEHGGDRPIIALGLAWLRANLPLPVAAGPVHGDFRLGNLMTHDGALTGVLDWELAHLGDFHEDLAYGCMAVWRFGSSKPAFGLGDLDALFDAYEANGGQPVDRARFRFWLAYRTVWWALGCLGMGQMWRGGADRSLERVVVARRAAEQELDLLLLLEDEAPESERNRPVPDPRPSVSTESGEPSAAEILSAVGEWLAASKDRFTGRDRFEHAVARNALRIVVRELATTPTARDRDLAGAILDGSASLATPGLLSHLRRTALDKLAADQPKYPSLAIARESWQAD